MKLTEMIPTHLVEENEIEQLEEVKEIDLGIWQVQEAENGLKKIKSGKTAQLDKVDKDLLIWWNRELTLKCKLKCLCETTEKPTGH